MTFDELWKQVEQLGLLPDSAIRHIPYVLQGDTKRKLCKQSPKDVAEIIAIVVN